jgi:hypothetical protein
MEKQRRICAELQRQVWEDVPFIPMGEYWQRTAYRKDLVDVLPGCENMSDLLCLPRSIQAGFLLGENTVGISARYHPSLSARSAG